MYNLVVSCSPFGVYVKSSLRAVSTNKYFTAFCDSALLMMQYSTFIHCVQSPNSVNSCICIVVSLALTSSALSSANDSKAKFLPVQAFENVLKKHNLKLSEASLLARLGLLIYNNR